MRTIFEEAKYILSLNPEGLSFDNLYRLVGKNLNLDIEQYLENKLDLYNDLNESIDVKLLGENGFSQSM